MKETFYAINRESVIAKAQEWAKVNNKFISKLEVQPEEPGKYTGWWMCLIEIIEQPEGYILQGITVENNINAV